MYYKGCIKIMYSEGGFYSLLGTEIRTLGQLIGYTYRVCNIDCFLDS